VISRDAGGDADHQFQQVQDMIKAGIKVPGFNAPRYHKGGPDGGRREGGQRQGHQLRFAWS